MVSAQKLLDENTLPRGDCAGRTIECQAAGRRIWHDPDGISTLNAHLQSFLALIHRFKISNTIRHFPTTSPFQQITIYNEKVFDISNFFCYNNKCTKREQCEFNNTFYGIWRNTQEAEEAPLLRVQVGQPARGFKSLFLRLAGKCHGP